MPLFKVSLESEVPVSAIVVSQATTEQDALAEVRFLQSRARVNWSRGLTKIGAIEAPYEIWAHPRPEGGWTVSLFAYIPVSVLQSVIAEDEVAVNNAVAERQSSGLIPWKYRGVPIGEYKEPIPTYWANRQPDVVTNVALSMSASSVYPGQSVVLSVDVTGPETPVGNVEFRDVTPGGAGAIVLTTLEADPVNPGLSHAQAVVVLPAGDYEIVGAYLGSDGFQPSQSAQQSLSVSKIATSVNITPPSPPIYAGQSVNLNAIVSSLVPGSPVPTGIITLFDGTTVIASTQVDSVGFGSFGLGTLDPGTYAFTIQYDGDDIHQGSSGSVSGITVQQTPTTMTMVALRSDSDVEIGLHPNEAVFSQPIRFRAVVTSDVDGTVPTGTIYFNHGIVTFATAQLVPISSNSSRAEVVADDSAIGANGVFGSYDGNASFAGTISDNYEYEVLRASTYVNAFSLNTPTTFKQVANFDATVGVYPPATKTPFQHYGVSSGVNYLTPSSTPVSFDGSGHAPMSTDSLPVGWNQVLVNFDTTSEYFGSQTQFLHIVTVGSVTINVTVSQDPVPYNAVVAITATLTANAPGGGVPNGGTISFSVYDPYFYGSVFLGQANIVNGVGSINYQNFLLISAVYTISWVYTGYSDFFGNSGSKGIFAYGYFG